MSAELVAVAIIVVVHLAGAGMLVWMLVMDDDADWRSWWPDDGPGGGGPGGPDGPVGPPLPDADQSPRRLRPPDRLRIDRDRAPARPRQAPERAPQPSSPTRRARI